MQPAERSAPVHRVLSRPTCGGAVEARVMMTDARPPGGASEAELLTEGNVLLVNGQFRPRVTMDAGRWYRWRLLYGSVGGRDLYPTLSGRLLDEVERERSAQAGDR